MLSKKNYIRFVGKETNLDTGHPKGLFTIAYELLENGTLDNYEEGQIRESLTWFSKHLPIPKKFSKKKNNYNRNNRSTTWIKDSANEIIKELMHLKQIVENAGINLDVLRSDNPGYVIYEDDFQVVVSPHSKRKVAIR